MQTEIKYSIITLLGIAVFYAIPYFISEVEIPMNSPIAYASLLVPIVTIYFGIRERKNKRLEGKIDFTKAFATGLIITIFYSVLLCLLLAFVWPYFDLQITAEMIETEREHFAGEGRSPDEVDELIRQLKGVTGLPMQLMQTFMSNLISGMLISVVVAFVFKRPEYPE